MHFFTCAGSCHVLQCSSLTLPLASSVWLKHWSEINSENGGNFQVGKYIGVYFAFGMGYSALVLFQTLLLWIFCSIEVRADPIFLYA